MINKRITAGLILAVCFSISLIAQQTAFEMASKMTRGINLGNTLDAENYEGGWAPAATEKTFDAFKEAGFTTVRIPITWHAYLTEDKATLRLKEDGDFAIHPDFLSRVDELIKWSLDRGFITVINIHHDHWIKDRNNFENVNKRFYALWEQLSEHYKDYPETLLFEIVNEPHHNTDGEEDGLTLEQLDDLYKKTLAIIRKNNPTRIAIYTGPNWSGFHELEKTPSPDKKDKYLMGTYHSYNPWSFAGEGIGSWGTEDDIKAMESEFIAAKAYSEKYKLPVFIGEYGCDHRAEYNARMLHYATFVENIQKYNFAATAWDDCGYLFKVYDRNSGVWDDAKDIIMNYGPESPNNLSFTIRDNDTLIIDWHNRAQDIKSVTIEKREGRSGAFEAIKTIEVAETCIDDATKKNQTYYYYRVVNELEDGTKLISYPKRVYNP